MAVIAYFLDKDFKNQSILIDIRRIIGCKTARAGPGIGLDLPDPLGSGKVGLRSGFAKTGSGSGRVEP
jgi:hypothetical protein